MTIFRHDFNPPKIFKNTEILIFPTDENYYLSDHKAVMKSREALRIWSQSDWPQDHFTAEQNREDLLLLVADNHNHQAYGYMIYSVDKERCLGSVYINPLSGVSENYQMTSGQIEKLEKFDARVDYWIISGEAELEKRITLALCQWFKKEWDLRLLLACRRNMKERHKVLQDLGLDAILDLTGKDSKADLVLYAGK